jgi:soluble lytic murein transglycosylase-like protein
MKRLIIAIAFIAAIGSQVPASGFQIDEGATVRPEVANIQAIKERVRERVRERFGDWYAEKIAALLEPEPVVLAEPSVSTPTTYPAGVLSAEEVASYARGAGFPESVIETMVAIAYRESRFNPNAVNSSSGACGLWQIYPCPGSEALDPARNAALAYSKYQSSGLSPWGM